jgi:hypothetical protein
LGQAYLDGLDKTSCAETISGIKSETVEDGINQMARVGKVYRYGLVAHEHDRYWGKKKASLNGDRVLSTSSGVECVRELVGHWWLPIDQIMHDRSNSPDISLMANIAIMMV